MINNTELLKEFTDFISLFDQPSKQAKIPHSSSEVLNRIGLTQITAILTNSDTAFAHQLLKSISTFFYPFLNPLPILKILSAY
ncbi:MAG: hypothetical protein K9W44_12620 [Candidatus Lokiarchaeota archaeon]|nr:hypothetical protein [Candidatus Harpocratesius repetitus]